MTCLGTDVHYTRKGQGRGKNRGRTACYRKMFVLERKGERERWGGGEGEADRQPATEKSK